MPPEPPMGTAMQTYLAHLGSNNDVNRQHTKVYSKLNEMLLYKTAYVELAFACPMLQQLLVS